MSQEDQDAMAAAWAAQLEEGEADAKADEVPAGQASGGGAADDDALAAQWADALAAEEKEKSADAGGEAPSSFSVPAQDARFKDMTETARQPKDNKLKRELDFILDIPLEVSAELGRARLLINELLQLGQGSVVELNKLAGEPLEVYVNGKLVARGEAVVINEKFGVRLTDIISPIERVKQLG